MLIGYARVSKADGSQHLDLPGRFTVPHGIATDSHGNIYVGELSSRYWSSVSKEPVPKKRRVIHRLRKLDASLMTRVA
ncbi:MAG: SBBP repeat-containing protein [Pseudomonadota bacterium]